MRIVYSSSNFLYDFGCNESYLVVLNVVIFHNKLMLILETRLIISKGKCPG